MKKCLYMLLGLSLVTLGACSQSKDGDDASSSQSTSQVASSTTVASSSAASSSSTTSSSVAKTSSSAETDGKLAVSYTDAVKIFRDTYPNSDITSVDLDDSFGDYFYKIEGVDDNKEYELAINAQTKEVRKEKEDEVDDDDDRQEDRLPIDDLIDLEKATELAEKAAGSGKAVEWDLDKDDGRVYWDVKVKDGSQTKEIKLDAKTGDVLETENDDDD